MLFFQLWWLWLVLAAALLAVAFRMARSEMNRAIENGGEEDLAKEYPTLRVKTVFFVGVIFAVCTLVTVVVWTLEFVMRGIEAGVQSIIVG